jgi:hypothetical protein
MPTGALIVVAAGFANRDLTRMPRSARENGAFDVPTRKSSALDPYPLS